eukprot:NODE_480_length_7860_cov_0.165958.p4 type:complete len:145 gc:universal NODE_480_length_7860_cov_0.165958:2267-2701(+)
MCSKALSSLEYRVTTCEYLWLSSWLLAMLILLLPPTILLEFATLVELDSNSSLVSSTSLVVVVPFCTVCCGAGEWLLIFFLLGDFFNIPPKLLMLGDRVLISSVSSKSLVLMLFLNFWLTLRTTLAVTSVSPLPSLLGLLVSCC